ncbi:hypothetical protein NQZ68_006029 [Dissostichus eleginoides]|nr:hypothetical protein NQZ68_006029 [Dissostichus eleginoides]
MEAKYSLYSCSAGCGEMLKRADLEGKDEESFECGKRNERRGRHRIGACDFSQEI